jgi:uncharacterized protein YkwD
MNLFIKPALGLRADIRRVEQGRCGGFTMKNPQSTRLSAFWPHLLVSLGLSWASGVFAEQNADLVNRINEYRNASAECEGRAMPVTGPLAPNPKLANVDLSSSQWRTAMHEAGYQASAAQIVQVSGPSDADQVMEMAKQRFCEVLRNGDYAEIGVRRTGNDWQIIMASPLVSQAIIGRKWIDVGQEVLAEVNLARRQPRTCGSEQFAAAQPLNWDTRLGQAALEHSGYMAENNILSHVGADGEKVAARVGMTRYEWRKLGENVAVGQSSPQQVVSAWLHSPGHCANIMNSEFTDMCAAFETRPQSSIYWTQVFASER